MTYKTLTLHQENAALRITLNRPEVLNALSLELLAELKTVLEQAASDSAVRAVMLTGAGRGFCSGADLSNTPIGSDIQQVVETSYNPVIRLLSTMPKPVIAAVNGVAAGAGLSLALACDVRLLAESASFTVGFSGIALAMDAGASYYLPRLIGRARTLELAYSNRRVNAEEALSLGLGEQLLPDTTFAQDSWSLLTRLAAGPTASLGLMKTQVNASAHNDLEAQLKLESELQARAAASRDAREGVQAFVERRAAVFEGH